jgi:phosphatidylethanolamine/phosphatidyl-N-methylethanolamine N-methyltransferase
MQGQMQDNKRATTFGDGARFLKSLVVKPHLTGAVAPSGRALARAMAAAAGPLPDGIVVELGPGTGPVTRALTARGVDRRRLVLVEFNPAFVHMLQSRFAPARVVEGDAYDLPRTLAKLAGEPVAAVVSSLPLLIQPPEKRKVLLDDAFAMMGPGGVFVQFTYGPVSPMPLGLLAGRYSAHCSAPIWLNLPPARVWTYRLEAARSESRG